MRGRRHRAADVATGSETQCVDNEITDVAAGSRRVRDFDLLPTVGVCSDSYMSVARRRPPSPIAAIDYVNKQSCFAKSRNFEEFDDDGHRTTLVSAPIRFQLCRRAAISVRATFTHTED
jgi:hypothetical protein